MTIHDAAILALEDLLPGDILIDYEESPDHSLMWVGGEKPVVHSADSGSTGGIVQQSTSCLGGLGGQGEPRAEVYRSQSRALASGAAEIAKQFAVISTDERYIRAKTITKANRRSNREEEDRIGQLPILERERATQLFKPKPVTFNLQTRFSQDRLGGDGGAWGPEAIVRAIRAFFRSSARLALSSKEGVTCSQFITYTYQAAAIAKLASKHRPTLLAIQQAANSGLLGRLGLHGLSDEDAALRVASVYDRVRGLEPAITFAVPAAMQVNASITSVDVLTNSLRADAAFVHLGNLASDDGSESD